ncbi:MAG TPA: hypothetical protein VFW51_00390, partial [Actinomycetota bacterium]|nr:hypothetical protein [Actinomycetota bacterium]
RVGVQLPPRPPALTPVPLANHGTEIIVQPGGCRGSRSISRKPNGTYWIEVRADPRGRLFVGDPTNHVELREVILRGRPGSRTVEAPPWHGIDTEGLFASGR